MKEHNQKETLIPLQIPLSSNMELTKFCNNNNKKYSYNHELNRLNVNGIMTVSENDQLLKIYEGPDTDSMYDRMKITEFFTKHQMLEYDGKYYTFGREDIVHKQRNMMVGKGSYSRLTLDEIKKDIDKKKDINEKKEALADFKKLLVKNGNTQKYMYSASKHIFDGIIGTLTKYQQKAGALMRGTLLNNHEIPNEQYFELAAIFIQIDGYKQVCREKFADEQKIHELYKKGIK